MKKHYTLNEALYFLLHHKAYREAFLADNFAALNLSPKDCKALTTIDKEELVKTASKIKGNLLKGNYGDNGGLRKAFSLTFQLLRGNGVSTGELMEHYLASTFYRDYKEVEFTGKGICLEESFFLFLKAEEPIFAEVGTLPNVVLRHEFFKVLLSILTISTRPSFTIASESELVRNGNILFTIQAYPSAVLVQLIPTTDTRVSQTYMLYAVTKQGHFINGAIDELLKTLMELKTTTNIIVQAMRIQEKYQLNEETLRQIMQGLLNKGLLIEHFES